MSIIDEIIAYRLQYVANAEVDQRAPFVWGILRRDVTSGLKHERESCQTQRPRSRLTTTNRPVRVVHLPGWQDMQLQKSTGWRRPPLALMRLRSASRREKRLTPILGIRGAMARPENCQLSQKMFLPAERSCLGALDKTVPIRWWHGDSTMSGRQGKIPNLNLR